MVDEDGLPLDEVGSWAKEKHERLRKYVDISRATRRKFVEGPGGASCVDLFCGSGRSVVRDTGERIDGSPLVAFKSAREGGVPFSQVHIADAVEDSCRAAEQRLRDLGATPSAYVGHAEDTALRISRSLNPYGLHFIFLDPYNLQDLPFSVFEAFASLKRVDILIHVSAQDLQRNLDAYASSKDSPLDRFAPGWKDAVSLNQSQPATRAAFIAYWASRLEALGLPAKAFDFSLRPKRAPRAVQVARVRKPQRFRKDAVG